MRVGAKRIGFIPLAKGRHRDATSSRRLLDAQEHYETICVVRLGQTTGELGEEIHTFYERCFGCVPIWDWSYGGAGLGLDAGP
jgi:hypothetical protein